MQLKIKIIFAGILSMLFVQPVLGQSESEALQDNLDTLMEGHVTLTLKSLRDSLDQAPTQQDTLAALEVNTNEIAEKISEIYTLEIGSDFLEIWRLRIGYFSDYLMYVESEDEFTKTEVLNNLENSDAAAAQFLEAVVTNFSATDAQAQLSSITNLFLGSTEDYANGNAVSANSRETSARNQIGVLSESLGTGIAADLILSQPDPEPEETETESNTSTETSTESTTTNTNTSDETDTNTSATTTSTSTETSTETAASTTGSTEASTETEVTTEALGTEILELSSLSDYPFSDVDLSHDYESILDMRDRGIVEGYDDGTYRPENFINRAEFTKIVIGAMTDTVSGSGCFPDVNDEWFAPFVCTAQDLSVVGGYPDGTFQPANQVNLAEAYKIVGESLFPGEALETTVWYEGYVNLGRSKGFYLGDAFGIGTAVTREQMATIMSRALATLEL